LVGFEKTIEHLDKSLVKVVRSDVTVHGHVEVIRGKGMPQHSFPSIIGDMLVEFVVQFPPFLTQKQKDGFRKLLA
jgi:DnaJ-related protein SCJ1